MCVCMYDARSRCTSTSTTTELLVFNTISGLFLFLSFIFIFFFEIACCMLHVAYCILLLGFIFAFKNEFGE